MFGLVFPPLWFVAAVVLFWRAFNPIDEGISVPDWGALGSGLWLTFTSLIWAAAVVCDAIRKEIREAAARLAKEPTRERGTTRDTK